MNEAKILFSCNAWHNPSSKDLMGIFTDDNALKQYLDDMKMNGLLDNDDMKMIQLYRQTQGKTLNYRIEEQEVNPKYKEE
jgi:hypothetical protein